MRTSKEKENCQMTDHQVRNLQNTATNQNSRSSTVVPFNMLNSVPFPSMWNMGDSSHGRTFPLQQVQNLEGSGKGMRQSVKSFAFSQPSPPPLSFSQEENGDRNKVNGDEQGTDDCAFSALLRSSDGSAVQVMSSGEVTPVTPSLPMSQLTISKSGGDSSPTTPNSPLNNTTEQAGKSRDTTEEQKKDDDEKSTATSTATTSTNRKEKSLRVLTDRFIELCNQKKVQTPNFEIKLDDVAKEMNVEKRRVYDIINVLESIFAVKKTATNVYQWIGLDELALSLNKIRLSALQDQQLYNSISNTSITGEEADAIRRSLECFPEAMRNSSQQMTGPVAKKSERSLTQLSQKFIQLFLVIQSISLSHQTVVDILFKNYNNITTESSLRTKVRRLYDVVNILTSLSLIQKCNITEGKKQNVFKWTGQLFNKIVTCTNEESQTTIESHSPITTASSSSLGNTTSTSNSTNNNDPSLLISPSKSVPLKKRKRTSRSVSAVQTFDVLADEQNEKQASNNETYQYDNAVDTTRLSIDSTLCLDTSGLASADSTPQKNDEEHEKENRTGYVSPTDRSGLHFQFNSPPPKRNRQCGGLEITPKMSTATQSHDSNKKPLSTLYTSNQDHLAPKLPNVTRVLSYSIGTTKFTSMPSHSTNMIHISNNINTNTNNINLPKPMHLGALNSRLTMSSVSNLISRPAVSTTPTSFTPPAISTNNNTVGSTTPLSPLNHTSHKSLTSGQSRIKISLLGSSKQHQ